MDLCKEMVCMLGTWVKKGGEIRRDWNCQDHGRREVAAEEEGGE